MVRLILLTLLAAPAWAECPAAPDIGDRQEALLAEIRSAPDAAAAQRITNRLWELWATAPDAHAQDLLDSGMERRAAHDLDGALAAFDALVAYCPHYAEGHNQRAFVNFIRQDYGAALVDLERTLELQPGHVAAQSGKALTLMGLGRMQAAQGVLRDALELNPWLPERNLLIEPPGEEL